MTKNQTIAAGCGGLGCLGLIVLLIALCVGYFFFYKPSQERTYNFNARPNSNSNSTSNSNSNSNTTESNSSSTSNSSSSSSSSYSDDDKHKLFQAAGVCGDADLNQKVLKKIGFFTAQGVPTEEYQQFVKDHFDWALKNTEFVTSVNTPEKAKEYIEKNL